MGKMKKKSKLHGKAPKASQQEQDRSNTQDEAMDASTDKSSVLNSVIQSGGGVFSKLDIDINALQQRLPADLDDLDVRSSVTNKSMKGLNLSKKEKKNLRHHIWLKKVDAIKEAKKEIVAKKRRQKTAVVGDMKPLEDTLPTLELLLRDSVKHATMPKPEKPKPVKKEKARKQQLLEDYAVFHQVANHPVYKENPLATIKEHLENRMKQEDS